MTQTKTSTQVFRETARGYWKAIGELAEVESRYGTEFQRQAYRIMKDLEKVLRMFLEEWNGNLEIGESAVYECRDAVSVAHHGKCDIYYTVAGDEDGRCQKCAEQKKIHDSWEHAR